MCTHVFIPFNIKNSILSRRANLFFLCGGYEVWIDEREEETLVFFTLCFCEYT